MTKRTKAALALALCLAFAMSACALPSPVPVADGSPAVASDFTPSTGPAQQSSGGYVVETTDMAGNAIRLSVYPERIVVLDPANCEILFAIGAGESVVGRSISCDYPAEVNYLPYATADGRNDPDLVLLREPQVVIMGAEDAADADLVSALASAGVITVVTNVTDVNNLYGAISLLGMITNRTAEANALVSQLITAIAAMQTKISAHSETVYLELTPLADGLSTLGNGTIFSSLLSLLGFRNEFEDQSGIISVTQDQVVGRSPNVILTVSRDRSTDEVDPDATPDPAGATLSGPAEILARSEWQEVRAVKSNRVYYIDAALITRASPRILEGINALYTALYEGRQPE